MSRKLWCTLRATILGRAWQSVRVECLRSAMQAGFVCAPKTLREDPWMGAVRESAWFGSLLQELETLTERGRERWAKWADTIQQGNWRYRKFTLHSGDGKKR